jgi:hypothetical protein
MKKLLTAIASAIIFASLAAIAPAQPVVGGNQIVTVMANKTTGNLSTPGNLTFTAGQTLAVTGGNISFSAPLTVANGGTGLATTANGFAVGAAANAYQFISASGNRVAGVNALAGNSPVLFTLGGNLSLSGNTISATGGNVYAAGNNTFTANNTFSGNLLGGNASFSTLTINGNTISGTGFTYSSSGGGNLSSFGGNKSFVISGGVNAPNTGNVSIMRNEINSGTMTISQGNRSFSIS